MLIFICEGFSAVEYLAVPKALRAACPATVYCTIYLYIVHSQGSNDKLPMVCFWRYIKPGLINVSLPSLLSAIMQFD